MTNCFWRYSRFYENNGYVFTWGRHKPFNVYWLSQSYFYSTKRAKGNNETKPSLGQTAKN